MGVPKRSFSPLCYLDIVTVHAASRRMLAEQGVLERVLKSLPLAAPMAGPLCHYRFTVRTFTPARRAVEGC